MHIRALIACGELHLRIIAWFGRLSKAPTYLPTGGLIESDSDERTKIGTNLTIELEAWFGGVTPSFCSMVGGRFRNLLRSRRRRFCPDPSFSENNSKSCSDFAPTGGERKGESPDLDALRGFSSWTRESR